MDCYRGACDYSYHARLLRLSLSWFATWCPSREGGSHWQCLISFESSLQESNFGGRHARPDGTTGNRAVVSIYRHDHVHLIDRRGYSLRVCAYHDDTICKWEARIGHWYSCELFGCLNGRGLVTHTCPQGQLYWRTSRRLTGSLSRRRSHATSLKWTERCRARDKSDLPPTRTLTGMSLWPTRRRVG